MKKTAVESVFTKDQQEVLDAIDGIKRLPKPGPSRHGNLKQYKRHDKAIDQLKKLGLIEKGPDSVLRRTANTGEIASPLFTNSELGIVDYALGQYMTGFAGDATMWNRISELRRKLTVQLSK